MDDLKKRLSKFKFHFPPVVRDASVKRNRSAEYKVPNQPEIDHLLLRILADTLEIPADENMWFSLALALARDKFPEPRSSGAKFKWHSNYNIALIGEVSHLQSTRTTVKSISHACRILASKEPWKNVSKSNDTTARSESLRKRYQNLKKDKPLFQSALVRYKSLVQSGQWNEFVNSL